MDLAAREVNLAAREMDLAESERDLAKREEVFQFEATKMQGKLEAMEMINAEHEANLMNSEKWRAQMADECYAKLASECYAFEKQKERKLMNSIR